MARSDFPIVGSLHQEIIPKVNAERTINMYEVQSPNGKKPSYLHPTPGKKQVGTLPFVNGNFGRASFTFTTSANPTDAFTYFVQGDTIYRMDSALVVTVIGDHFFTTTTGFVAIAAN